MDDNLLRIICEKYNIEKNDLISTITNKNKEFKFKSIGDRYMYDLDLKFKYLNNQYNNIDYLLNVYENIELFKKKDILDYDDDNLLKYPHAKPKIDFTKNIAKNINEFKLRLQKLTNGQLDNIKWNSKFVIAGGIINAAFTGNTEYNHNSDIDIFIVKEMDDDEFKETITEIHDSLQYEKKIYKTSTTLNILGRTPNRPIQIPLKITQDLTQLLLFFDLDCAAIAYDGKNLYTLPRFIDCINTGYNFLDPYKVTKKIYLDRINKYYERGYGLLISHFDKSGISNRIMNEMTKRLKEKNLSVKYSSEILNDDQNEEYYEYSEMTSQDVPKYIEKKELQYEYPEITSYYVPKNSPKHIEDSIYSECDDINKFLLGDLINLGWNDKTLLIKENIIRCYMCKKYIKYNGKHMCHACDKINYNKRQEMRDLSGQVAIVTGGRVKIGYYTSLKLLRCNAQVIVTSRFPQDTFYRYSKEEDFNVWKHNLTIYAIDFRHLTSVMNFINYVNENYKRVDILINNAAQTVKRPPQYYKHLIENEKNQLFGSDKSNIINCDSCLKDTGMFLEYKKECTDIDKSMLPLSVSLSQIRIGDEEIANDSDYPENQYDKDGQQIDLRKINSWNSTIENLSTIELVEVQIINSIVPSLLISKLKCLMVNKEMNSKHIINVQSPEGQFSIKKSSVHPHTNMSKAALNQLTQTIASEFIKDNIYVNSVDVGWASSCVPTFIDPPLTYEDSAARILDPIFNVKYYGKLLKDYKVCNW